jgi:hypothetical protein
LNAIPGTEMNVSADVSVATIEAVTAHHPIFFSERK